MIPSPLFLCPSEIELQDRREWLFCYNPSNSQGLILGVLGIAARLDHSLVIYFRLLLIPSPPNIYLVYLADSKIINLVNFT